LATSKFVAGNFYRLVNIGSHCEALRRMAGFLAARHPCHASHVAFSDSRQEEMGVDGSRIAGVLILGGWVFLCVMNLHENISNLFFAWRR
jgi:hypothetical protein